MKNTEILATANKEWGFWGMAGDFRLSPAQAKTIVREVAAGVSQWREVAQSLRLEKREIDRMASAFEHKDSVDAQKV